MVMDNVKQCPNCSKIKSKVIEMGLVDGETYYQKRQCMSCQNIYNVNLPLVEPEDGWHTLIQNNLVGSTSLHRLVWEWQHGKPPEGVVHHLNGKKRDNRPCNLHDMVIGHSAKLNNNSSTKISVLKGRIRELEAEVAQLKAQSKFDLRTGE